MPPALVLISFIAFVAFVFGLSCIYGQTPYWKLLGIYKRLKIKFGLRYERKFLKAKITASGYIEGQAVTISPRDIEGVPFLHILLENRRFLPGSLQIVKNSRSALGEDPPSQVLRLDPDGIPAINRSAGRPVLDQEIAGLLGRLSALTSDFAFSAGTGSLMIAFNGATAAAVEEAVSAAAQLPARLKKAARTANLALHALICGVWNIAEYDGRRTALRLLIEGYRNEPPARQTLAAVKDGLDFGLGRLAAEALGIGPLSYVRSCFDRLIAPDKSRAIRLLVERGMTGGSALFIAALKDEAVEVRSAAVAALAEKGRTDALAPLYALSTDKRHPALAAQAKEASAAIRRRLGLEDTGALSLAEPESGAGALSVAEKSPDGRLSPAQKPRRKTGRRII